ncbi:CHRD domain-containing protein [Candidatus Acetothermia bacterium]|nr:CHRD domain-containing protein [Candidatus Acetothermia bacterium]
MVNALKAEKLYLTLVTSKNSNGEIRGQLELRNKEYRKSSGAICNDGWPSDSTGSGTCSHHKGVREWCPCFLGRDSGFVSALNLEHEFSTSTPLASDKTPASGSAFFRLDYSGTKLDFYMTYANLTGPPTAIHFHRGKLKETGPIVHTICGAPDGKPCDASSNATVSDYWWSFGAQGLTPELIEALKAGEIYIEVDTANPNGEIRGQLTK